MLAVVKAEKGVAIKDLPYPKLEDNSVIIKVKYAGLCGSDINRYLDNIYMPPGIVLGHEFSGVIAEKGANVHGIEIGDRVTSGVTKTCGVCRYCHTGRLTLCGKLERIGLDFNGGFASYVVVPETLVHPLPGDMTFQAGASVEPVAVAVRAVDKVKISGGDTVLVYGPGPIGLYAMQVALASGAGKTIVVGTRAPRLELAHRLGSTHTINIREENLHEKVAEYTEGLLADVVVEAAGTPDIVDDVFATTCKGGWVVFTGLPHEHSQFDLQAMVRRELNIHSSILNSWDDSNRAIKLLDSGKVKTSGIITHELPLEEFESAVKMVLDRKAIKVLLKVPE